MRPARSASQKMSLMSVDELLDGALDYARFTLVGANKDTELFPVFFVQYANGQPNTMVTAPWGGEDEKVMVIHAMRAMLKRTNAHSYWFVSEAWMAYEDTRHSTGLMPSQREDKREVVITNAYDRHGGKMRMYDIQRGPDGAITDLVADPHNDETSFSGRLANLLADA
jgi:hypothetical protein